MEVDGGSERVQELAFVRHSDATARWRSWKTALLLTPCLFANALLPAVPGGASLTGVGLSLSLALYGIHFAAFIIAAWVWHATGKSPSRPAYIAANRADGTLWVVLSAFFVGWSGQVMSVYWLHILIIVIVSHPNVPSHRPTLAALAVGCGIIVAFAAASGDIARIVLACAMCVTVVGFHVMSMRIAVGALGREAHRLIAAERKAKEEVAADRRRIAQELHDGLGADLSSILWQAQALDGEPSDVAKITEQVRASIQHLRSVVKGVEISPMSFEELRSTLYETVHGVVGDGTRVNVDEGIQRDIVIDGATCWGVLRIAKEAAHNSARHGAATTIGLRLCVEAGALSFILEDDGGGRVEAMKSGTGMSNMRQRASALGGDIQWTDIDPRGICVTLEIPMPA